MGNNKRVLVGVLVSAALAFAGPAHAQTLLEQVSYSGCGWGAATGLKVCASADIFYYDDGTMKMHVWNLETAGPGGLLPEGGVANEQDVYDSENGGWHTIFAVALAHDEGAWTPTGDLSSAYYITSGGQESLGNWFDDAPSLQATLGSNTQPGHQQGIVGCTDPGPLSADHKSTCGTLSFVPYVEFNFANVDLGGHALSDFDFVWQSAQIGNDLEDSAKGVIPEPITMVLFGSGLVGVGAAARRKRNGLEIESES